MHSCSPENCKRRAKESELKKIRTLERKEILLGVLLRERLGRMEEMCSRASFLLTDCSLTSSCSRNQVWEAGSNLPPEEAD